METFANFVIKYRKAILAICVLATAIAAAFATRLKVDTDFASYLSPTDPVIVRSREIGNAFGGNYTAVVLIESQDTFAPEILRGIARLTHVFKEHPGVTSVVSLTNVVDVKKTDTGLEVTDLIPGEGVFDDPAALDELRRYTLGKAAYANFLVSPDGRFTAIYVNIAEDARKDVVANDLRAAVEKMWPEAGRPARISFAGQPMLMTYLDHIVVRDMVVLVPLVILLLVGILYFSFRTLRGVVLPLVAVVMAAVLTFGIMGLTGAPLTLIAAIMPVVLMSNGSAYGIHMLNFISLSYARSAESAGAVREALRLVALPILLSAVTTFIGFFSFVAGLLTIFESFGIYTAIGIAAAFVLAVMFIPAVASGLKPPRTVAAAEGKGPAAASFLNRPLVALSHLLDGRPRLALAVVLLTILAFLPGIFRLKSDFDLLGFFAKDSEPRKADAVMTREFGGTMAYQLHVRGPVKDPLALGEMYRLHKHLRATLGSPLVNSIADVIAELNDSLNGQRAVPATKAGVESLYLLMEGKSQLKQLVTSAADQALIVGRLPERSSAVTKRTVAAVDRMIREELRPKLVALPFAAVEPARRAELAALVAGELLDDLAADLAYAGRELKDPAGLRPLLQAAVGRGADVAALPVAERQRVVAAYLAAEDCDLAIDDSARRETLAVALAGLAAPTADALERQIRATAPALAEDEEGVKLAATAASRLLSEETRRRDTERLLGAVLAASTPAGEPTALLASELRGELGRLFTGAWPVTPERYASFTGRQPDAESVVTVAVTQSGYPSMFTTILDRVVESQIYSLVLCLALVLVVMIAQMRSIRGGAIAMFPIVFTLIFNFGLMGYLGVTLNVVTALIASLAIGIGIDYTIHAAYRIRAEVAQGGGRREILERVFLSTGRAVLINAFAVMAGFLVIVASEISALKVFGWLSALSIGLSALGALTIYPVLIMTLNPSYITPRTAAPPTHPSQGGNP